MAQSMINIRMDTDEKNSFEDVCDQLGLTITAAFKMFVKKVIREQSKDFEGKFSDAKIMREYLEGIARNTYYKYKKELATEYKN